jgi:WD40 repeat protein
MTTPGPVATLAFDADGTTLASTASNGTTELWDVATQSQTGAPLAAQVAAVGAIAFGAGGLAPGNGNGTVQLWDPALFHRAAAPLAVGMPGGRGSAAIGGDVFAVADGHGTIRLRNTSTGRRTGSAIAGHRAVTALALSANGRIPAWLSRPGFWPPPAPSRAGP